MALKIWEIMKTMMMLKIKGHWKEKAMGNLVGKFFVCTILRSFLIILIKNCFLLSLFIFVNRSLLNSFLKIEYLITEDIFEDSLNNKSMEEAHKPEAFEV